MSNTQTPVSRTVNAERLVLLGWPRAVLLQFAHPLVAAGVYEHSGFREKPSAAIRRLEHTVRAMLALTFGSDDERERALESIRTIHRRVHGTLSADVGRYAAGTPYSAENADLVLWVHATMLESVPMFYELLVAPLTDGERDAYCAEAAPAAVALGARTEEVPRSRAALNDYIERMRVSGELAVGAQAKELARHVLSPPLGAVAAPGTYMSRVLTLGTLPEDIRRDYGFRWTAREERALRLLIPALHRLRGVLPRRAAMWRAARRHAA